MSNKNRLSQPHLANSVIMVRPLDFGYNEQTGLDNEFQHRPRESEQSSIRKQVFQEFEASMQQLQISGIEVLLLEKQHTDKTLPDAIFPNNWFSTCSDGRLIIYPMKTENRKDEVQILQLTTLANQAGYKITDTIDLRNKFAKEQVLEGTGSLILHHPNNVLFAAISERCQEIPLDRYAEDFGYQLVKFKTLSAQNSPIYHTNVLMSCGEDFAVIADAVVMSADKEKVMTRLSECVNDILVISEEQMSLNFCGNILQLKDANNQPVIAMSKSAYQGFTGSQRKLLEKHGSLTICDIPTIERIGGGSLRCMLAENFLEKI